MNGAIIIETRKLPNFAEIVFNHWTFTLWPVTIFHSYLNERHVKEHTFHIPGISYVQLTYEDLTERQYNELLTSDYFWKIVPYEKVLVFQHDSKLLRTGINEFIEDGADWYGAPWTFQERGGNGGLSLRTKSAMLEVINRVPYDMGLHGNEDVFFSNHLEKVASREMCSKFSCEAIFSTGSMGYHAIEKWLTPEQCEIIKTQYGH